MNDFDYDVLQKKKTARGARYVKRGSRSKKCTLPSDYMTATQKRRMNGTVETYNLSDTMSWKAFKALPTDLKEEYISNIVGRFDASQRMVAADLFKVSDATLSLYLKGLGLGWPETKRGKKKLDKESIAVWKEFCGVKQPIDLITPAPDAIPDVTAPKEEVRDERPARCAAELLQGSISLRGSVPDIASKLVTLLGANGDWVMRIDFTKES